MDHPPEFAPPAGPVAPPPAKAGGAGRLGRFALAVVAGAVATVALGAARRLDPAGPRGSMGPGYELTEFLRIAFAPPVGWAVGLLGAGALGAAIRSASGVVAGWSPRSRRRLSSSRATRDLTT